MKLLRSFCTLLILLIPLALLIYFSYTYHELKSDIHPINATIVQADPQISGGAWLVVTKYNFTIQTNETFQGIDAKSFWYDKDGAFAFAKQKQTEIFYKRSNPDLNGFAWFLDLTWWIVAVVVSLIFSLLACLPIILVFFEMVFIVQDSFGNRTVQSKENDDSIDVLDFSTNYPPTHLNNLACDSHTSEENAHLKNMVEKV